jgi:hypothetical protein
MVLPDTDLSLGLIQSEFGGAFPISLTEYYTGGLYVSSGPTPGIPTGGGVAFSNFLGKSKTRLYMLQGNLIRRHFYTNNINISDSESTMNDGFNNTLSEGGLTYATNFSLPVGDNYCMEYTGWLTIDTSGPYTFGLRSDDGSEFAMWIGGAWSIVSYAYGQRPTDLTPPHPGTCNLTAGVAYPIRIRYYEKEGGETLILDWKPLSTTTWASIPFTVFSCNGMTPISTTTIRQGFPEPRIIPGNKLRLDGYAPTKVSGSTWSTNVVGGLNASINGSPEYTNPWFTFNHESKFLQIPHVSNVTDFTNAQAYTIMAYLNINSTQVINAGNEYAFIEKWEYHVGYPYCIRYSNGGITALAYDGTNVPSVSAPLTGLLDKWVHVAVTYDHINKRMTLYFNGAQVAQLTSYTLNNCSNNHAVYVMRRFDNTIPLSAKLGHVSIYNSSLSQQSIDQHYNAYKPYFPESPISGMVFNVTFGTPVVPTQDSTGNIITTSSTAPTMVKDATRGWVVSLNNSFLNVPTFDIPVSYTKMCWAYSTASDSARNLMSSGNGTGGVHYMYNTNAYLAGGHNSSGAVIDSVTDPNVTPINVWIHWALTYDNTSKTMALYRNGTNVVSRVDTALNWTGGGNFLRIGAYTIGAFYNGFLDNARVFNRALVASEVLTIYNAESSGGTWFLFGNAVVNFDASSLSLTYGIDTEITSWQNDGLLTKSATGNGTTKPRLRKLGNYYHVEFNRANNNHFNISELPFTWFNVGGIYNGLTVFVVAQFTNIGHFERFIDFSSGQGNNNIWFGRKESQSRLGGNIWNGSSEVVDNNGAFTENSNFQIFTMHVTNTSNGGTNNLYCDSVTTALSSSNFTTPIANRASTQNYIGRSAWPTDAYLNANMRQLLIYNTALTQADLSKVYSELKTKWGL